MDKNSKEFKELKAKWYKKLEEKGFNDIEQDEEHLKAWHSHYFRERYSPSRFEAKQEYYRAASKFFHDYKFENPTDKSIWRLHVEGLSSRDIAAYRQKNCVRPWSFPAVAAIIKRLSKEMRKHYDANSR